MYLKESPTATSITSKNFVITNKIITFWLLSSRTPLHMDGGLDHFFPNFIPLDLDKDGLTII